MLHCQLFKAESSKFYYIRVFSVCYHAQLIEYMVAKFIRELIIYVGAKFLQECDPSSSRVYCVFSQNQPIAMLELTNC